MTSLKDNAAGDADRRPVYVRAAEQNFRRGLTLVIDVEARTARFYDRKGESFEIPVRRVEEILEALPSYRDKVTVRGGDLRDLFDNLTKEAMTTRVKKLPVDVAGDGSPDPLPVIGPGIAMEERTAGPAPDPKVMRVRELEERIEALKDAQRSEREALSAELRKREKQIERMREAALSYERSIVSLREAVAVATAAVRRLSANIELAVLGNEIRTKEDALKLAPKLTLYVDALHAETRVKELLETGGEALPEWSA